MYKIAVDAMGGDKAPGAVIKACINFIANYPKVIIDLFGDENKLRPLLINTANINIVHTTEQLSNDCHDVSLLIRNNKEASMLKAMHQIDKYDAFISAGPTQALIAGTHFIIGRLQGIQRLAYAPVLPNFAGHFKVLLDAGANTTLTPEQLNNLACGGALYHQLLFNTVKPKVGLLNIGEEANKGRENDIKTNQLLAANSKINFIGNIEPGPAFNGVADVIINDGFTGNIFLKTLEAFYHGLKNYLKEKLIKKMRNKIGFLFLQKDLKALKKQIDPNQVGGAILLGARKIVIKVHGSMNEDTFYGGLKLVTTLLDKEFIVRYQSLIN